MDGPGLEPGTPGFSVHEPILEVEEQARVTEGVMPCLGHSLGEGVSLSPHVLARQLILAAANAPDPRPLLDAAQALLAQSSATGATQAPVSRDGANGA